jgi:phosphate transport system protein
MDRIAAAPSAGQAGGLRAQRMGLGDDPAEGHTAKVVDQSLSGLRMLAIEMGGLVIDQVGSAVRALLDGNSALAAEVLAREPLVNDYNQRLDRETLTFIALQQPVASDLRLVRAIARAGLELERVGDEAKKIARFAGRSADQGRPDAVKAVGRSLRHMAELSVRMLRNAVRALDDANADLAREVLANDAELDTEYANALRQLMSFVMEDHQFLRSTIDTLFALKGLERIGDHAKNVAEQALYMLGDEESRPARPDAPV